MAEMKPFIDSDQFEYLERLMRLGVASGCNEQASTIMKFLRVAITPTLETTIFEAWQLISVRQFQEARQILEDAAQSHPGHDELKAVLATALFFADDSLWETYAFEVEHSGQQEETALGLVSRLKAAAETGLTSAQLHGLMLQPLPVQVGEELSEVH
jgi:thioredoxin-like negative regulator of GroEL